MRDGSQQTPLLEAIDSAPLSRGYWLMAVTVMLSVVLEFFDLFLIAFVLPEISDDWDLTFGQGGAVLLGAGLGAIVGAMVWGRLGDLHGRKRPLVFAVISYSLATGASALAPEGGWWFLASLRLVVGFGVGGLAATGVPLLLELTPTRVRSKLVGLMTASMIPVGIFLAAAVTAVGMPLVGWRPLFALGLLPLLLVPVLLRRVPESPRWLLARGRGSEARAVVASLFDLRPSDLAVGGAVPAESPATARDLLRYRRSFWTNALAWFGAGSVAAGAVLWGPTFLETLLDVEPEKAAALFILVTLGALAGRLTFSFLPDRIGRRSCGLIAGFGAAPLLVLTGIAGDARLAGVSLFLLALVAAAFFFDGGYANLTPYTPEVYPTELRARGMGVAQALHALGRLFGPAVVALIAGTGDLVEPEATADAVLPAFAFLGCCSLLTGFAFIAAIEPHGKDLETVTAELEPKSGLASSEGRTAEASV